MFSRLIITIAAFTIAAYPLHAQPVVGNSEFGIGSITGDPSQNLAFLDLTVTEGIPLATMQTELAPGGTYEGWRYATLIEVAAFINSFGWSPPITDPTQSSQAAGLIADTITQNFIGSTLSSGTQGYLQDGMAVQIFSVDVGPGLSTFVYTTPSVTQNIGHWLVRDSGASTPMYQGTLADAETPVDADADFRVTLVTNFGIPLETIELTQVPVNDGLFTIPLSFDPTLFESPGAMLRIEVRIPSGAGGYETITPDQPISPAPSAVFAQRAAEADSANVASALSNQESRPLTLFAGTEIYGAGYLPPTATRIGNTVMLNGLVRDVGSSSFPAGNTFAILDEGMRPNGRLVFLQASSAGAYRIDVNTDGTLTFQGIAGASGPIVWVSLDGISFPIE